MAHGLANGLSNGLSNGLPACPSQDSTRTYPVQNGTMARMRGLQIQPYNDLTLQSTPSLQWARLSLVLRRLGDC